MQITTITSWRKKNKFFQMTRVHEQYIIVHQWSSASKNDDDKQKSCMTSWRIFSFHSKTKYYNDNYYYLPSVFWSSLFVDDDFVLFCFAGKRWWWTENIEKIGINYFLLLAFLMIIFCCFFVFWLSMIIDDNVTVWWFSSSSSIYRTNDGYFSGNKFDVKNF